MANWIVTLLALSLTLPLFAADPEEKGLLQEIRLGTDENNNTEKAASSEVLISKSEEQAIRQLEKLQKKFKGSAQEGDIQFRLAELYMRRSKSGRFFDLYRDEQKIMSLIPDVLSQKTAKKYVADAVNIYSNIIAKFPKFGQMDEVLFNSAFAEQQLGHDAKAIDLFDSMIRRFPKSNLVPEAYISLGEIYYKQAKFEIANDHFVILERWPDSRVYPFGLYKSAWALYNLKQSKVAMGQLEKLIKMGTDSIQKHKQHLRTEAIRDLALFYADDGDAGKAYAYFSHQMSDAEAAGALLVLASLYETHGRHKEIIVFLNDVVIHQPNTIWFIKAHHKLAQVHEYQKNKTQVLVELQALNALCVPTSAWRKANAQPDNIDLCTRTIFNFEHDLVANWWDSWNRHQRPKELLETQRMAFETFFQLESIEKIDYASHFAYAELLFSTEKYLAACHEYDLVARGIDGKDKIQHDAAYASIVSLDQDAIKNKSKVDFNKMIVLLDFYLSSNPHGSHEFKVLYKRAFLYFEAKDFEQTKYFLTKIIGDPTKSPKILAPKPGPTNDIRTRSEDLMLDLYNRNKNYVDLIKLALSARNLAETRARQEHLLKLEQQSELMIVQALVENKKEYEAAVLYKKFYDGHQTAVVGQDLARKALLESIRLYYKIKRPFDGAELSQIYFEELKKHRGEKLEDLLSESQEMQMREEAVRAYLSVGSIAFAARDLEIIAKILPHPTEAREKLWSAYEIQGLLGLKSEQGRILKLLHEEEKWTRETTAEEKMRVFLIRKEFFKDQPQSLEAKQIQAEIQSKKIEPYYSENLLQELRLQFAAKKWAPVFEGAKKILQSNAPAQLRAEAKEMQAMILEGELVKQSVKAKPERIAMVIAIKTDRLDKATSSYTSFLTMADSDTQRLHALSGLERCYTNYADALQELLGSDTFNTPEGLEVKNQLNPLLTAMRDKAKEALDARLGLEKNIPAEAAIKPESRTPSSLAVEIQGPLHYVQNNDFQFKMKSIQRSQLRTYVPRWDQDIITESWIWVKDLSDSKGCTTHPYLPDLSLRTLGETANKCFRAGQFSSLFEVADGMMKQFPEVPWGAMYMAHVMESRGLLPAALWYLSLAEKKNDKISILHYQKANLLFNIASSDFASGSESQMADRELKLGFKGHETIGEARWYFAIEAFNRRDWKKAEELLNFQFDTPEPMSLELSMDRTIALSECFAKLGRLEESIQKLESLLTKKKDPVLYLELGHIFETILKDKAKAKRLYGEANKVLTDRPDLKDFFDRKLEAL